MKINSWKQALKSGILSGIILFVEYVAFVFIMSYLTDGQTFIKYDITIEKIGIIYFDFVTILGVILFSTVPVIILRYQKIKYIFLYVLSGTLVLIVLYCLVWGILQLIYCILDDIIYCPLNTFDGVYYAILLFRGSGMGVLLALIINLIKNKSLEKNYQETDYIN